MNQKITYLENGRIKVETDEGSKEIEAYSNTEEILREENKLEAIDNQINFLNKQYEQQYYKFAKFLKYSSLHIKECGES